VILLSNGRVVDGSGSPGREASVLIHGGRIREVGAVAAASDMEVVDCSGLTVTPGFIDVHSHSDLEVLEHRAEKVLQV
jgi:N-acyl-D-aspartate/D-glutamate deacylase